MENTATVKMKIPMPFSVDKNDNAARIRKTINQNKLHTVCESAACPNMGECWQQGTATFMIMGDICTRRCKFCNIKTARPGPLDPAEPKHLSDAIFKMKLKHAVVTSVDRDDLKDCGSEHFAECIQAIKENNPGVFIEVLIPDFKAQKANLEKIWNSKPDIINHNVETVPDLYSRICPQSNYQNSLNVLKWSKEQGFKTKSGLILGLGENKQQVEATITDLAKSGIDFLTIGQYLQPSKDHAAVVSIITNDEFKYYKNFANETGIRYTESGPLVRSSYHAQKIWDLNQQ